MSVVVDHVFICTPVDAPAAEKLIAFGLHEGAPNVHHGQGTACRRFFLRNAMLELLWVADPTEAQSEQTRDTRLWERWLGAGRGSSPFGIIVRPTNPSRRQCPFPSWDYVPQSMPGLVLQIASNTALHEPMWCYMEAGRRPDETPPERRQPMEHPAGLREITGVRLSCPSLAEASVTAVMASEGVIACQVGKEHQLELEFDGQRIGRHADFRPDLPLVFRY